MFLDTENTCGPTTEQVNSNMPVRAHIFLELQEVTDGRDPGGLECLDVELESEIRSHGLLSLLPLNRGCAMCLN